MDIDLYKQSANGLQITKNLRNHKNDARIIVHSCNNNATSELALTSGTNAFIANPTTMQKVRAVVNLS